MKKIQADRSKLMLEELIEEYDASEEAIPVYQGRKDI
jgi:hypothetical protein